MTRAPLVVACLLCVHGAAASALELTVGSARFSIPASSLKDIRFRHTLRQQTDFSCGSAALATLLSYHYRRPISEQQVFEQMFLRGDRAQIRRHGFSMLDMKNFLATQGFAADGFRLPLDQLAQAGLPAIVLMNDKGYQHFVVIKGIADGRVLVGDPARGTRALSRRAFETAWVGQLLFVVHGAPDKPRFNSAQDWQAAPAAPLAAMIARDPLTGMTLPKLGPGDF